jgi:cytosine/adenosine deaminase-related metal-dependent hydrolase
VPCIDPIGALVLNANVSDVDSVFVAGKQVKKDGKLVGINWEDLARQLRQSSNRIVEGFDTIDKQEIENAAASVLLEPH